MDDAGCVQRTSGSRSRNSASIAAWMDGVDWSFMPNRVGVIDIDYGGCSETVDSERLWPIPSLNICGANGKAVAPGRDPGATAMSVGAHAIEL